MTTKWTCVALGIPLMGLVSLLRPDAGLVIVGGAFLWYAVMVLLLWRAMEG